MVLRTSQTETSQASSSGCVLLVHFVLNKKLHTKLITSAAFV